ncbi:hypothetical protein CYMTET_12227 [Cymbomonas tetramitiformis]|uniref:Uncharacterized protein n=1 Tax=Cymbomonas tetramitiformis TaxID=36881 RepID=A0AAE0GKP4_9CHLO|nr:hypothetical protein CYMTET_12227 [Cymbomonas tetramitiformis]
MPPSSVSPTTSPTSSPSAPPTASPSNSPTSVPPTPHLSSSHGSSDYHATFLSISDHLPYYARTDAIANGIPVLATYSWSHYNFSHHRCPF